MFLAVCLHQDQSPAYDDLESDRTDLGRLGEDALSAHVHPRTRDCLVRGQIRETETRMLVVQELIW
jgi:hypothetical protein